MFHAPEQYRITSGPRATKPGIGNNGAFLVKTNTPRYTLFVIASDGLGWEHVSAHGERAGVITTPSWEDMCFLKDLFWDGEDVVIQYHPPKSQYVNVSKFTLHLWRPIGIILPTPPLILV